MGEVNSDNFRSEHWVEGLRSFADAVIKCFEWNLAAINGPGMGIQLEAKLRCSLQINPRSISDQNSRRLDENERIARIDDPLLRSLEDMTFFDAWLNQPTVHAKRLLLLAPFGSGKSVMLAKFALVLAKRLKEWCGSPDKSAPPLVPFPVRLRGWGGRGRFWGYMIGGAQKDAQTDVLGQILLSADDIKQLRDHSLLLPILDGFDELPDGVSDNVHDGRPPRAQLVDEMLAEPSFRARMILASRPGHGAESGPYAERATIHELGELHQDKAESFIRERLADLNPSALQERIMRYRKAQPAINDLFRRPLFLTAWCAKAILPGVVETIPTNISGLMGVCLEHVLDARLATYPADNGLPLTKELLENRHLLGAVLAIHAEEGFAIPLRDSAEKKGQYIQWNIIADDAGYKRCVQSAIKAGLLICGLNGTYTHKIPIVEYLIGCYYAWLAIPESEADLERPRRLARLFQKRFWWKDHEEIWLYAFDQMWHGSHPQWQWAGALAEWVLNLSGACFENANWDEELPEGDRPEDYRPFSFDDFILGKLLPVDDIPSPAKQRADQLIEGALTQLKTRCERIWRCDKSAGSTLEQSFRRWPRSLQNWLLDSLSKANKEYLRGILDDVERTGAYWEPSSRNRLFDEFLSNRDFKENWWEIARVIGGISAEADFAIVERMLSYLSNPEYKEAWFSIAFAMSCTSERISPGFVDRLFSFLSKPQYREEWKLIASAIGKISTPEVAGVVDRLVEYLLNPVYKAEWRVIAFAIGRNSTQINAATVDLLLEFLANQEYEDAWRAIAFAIDKAPTPVRPAVVHQLLDYLSSDRYSMAWEDIAASISKVSSHVGPDAIIQLTGYLNSANYEDAWPNIADIIVKVLGSVAPLKAKQQLQYTGIPAHKRSSLNFSGRDQLWPADAVLRRRAGKLASSGQIARLVKLVNGTPDLIWFVRNVNSKAEFELKIIYGIAERHDADLLLNIDFAPADIRSLLEPDHAINFTRSKIASLEQDDFLDEIAKLVKCLGRDKMVEFRQAWSVIAKTTKTVRYKQMIRLLLRPLTRTQRDQFCWKTKERGSKAASDMSKERSSLRIHAGMLAEILEGEDKKGIAKRLLDLVIGCDPFVPSWLDYIAASHDCPACGAVHPVDDGDSSDGTPPRHCRACNTLMPETVPTETPTDLLHCRSQKEPPLSFLRNPPKPQWDNLPRRDNYCPCEACTAERKKLLDPKSER